MFSGTSELIKKKRDNLVNLTTLTKSRCGHVSMFTCVQSFLCLYLCVSLMTNDADYF